MPIIATKGTREIYCMWSRKRILLRSTWLVLLFQCLKCYCFIWLGLIWINILSF